MIVGGTMKNPLVSVIIPTFNRIHTLSELVESLSRQSFQDFEVIIVNDQGDPVESIASLYPELTIRVINPAEKLHHAGCRNVGVGQARGTYIMLCDDDDFVVPGHLQRMVNAIQTADFVYTDVEMVDFEVKENVRWPITRTLFAYEFEEQLIRKFNTYVSSGSLYKKDIHSLIGLFDRDLHNYWDWDFFLRVIESGVRVTKLPVASTIYAFSSRGDNMSARLNEKRETYLQKLIRKHNLGQLSQENFWTMMEKPFVKKKQSETEIVWDGKPMEYRK